MNIHRYLEAVFNIFVSIITIISGLVTVAGGVMLIEPKSYTISAAVPVISGVIFILGFAYIVVRDD